MVPKQEKISEQKWTLGYSPLNQAGRKWSPYVTNLKNAASEIKPRVQPLVLKQGTVEQKWSQAIVVCLEQEKNQIINSAKAIAFGN